MLYSRALNNELNGIYERALKTVYSDHKPFYNKFLDKDGSFTIHPKNFQSLATEMYKYLCGLSPKIFGEIFKANDIIPFYLRIPHELYARNPKTARYGTKTKSKITYKNFSFSII